METTTHLSITELEAGLDHIHESPKDQGRLMLIVRRPNVDEREIVEECEINLTEGLVGDTWKVRGSRHTSDGSPNIDAQITLMNSRVIALLAQEPARWSLAGDQLYVDLDLSDENLSTGTRLTIGSAILEVSAAPHTGCKKFASRYGTDATKFVNSPEGKRLRLRGINARVIEGGTIKAGDVVAKV